MFFLGEYTHSIDEKGRLTIPARFREALGTGSVITRGFDKNLMIYTAEAFAQVVAKARALSPTVSDNRDLLRMLFSNACEIEFDKIGRIVIPPYLRQYAGLGGEVAVVGTGLNIEVWSREAWDGQLAAMNDPEANARRFAALDLATG